MKVPDADGGNKRDRLAGALLAQQARQRASNCVIAFIKVAMAPVRFVQQPHTFSRRQDDLNEVLVHVGLRINDQGQVARGPAAATLSEAARHASSLRSELRRRSTHPEVLRYARLLAERAHQLPWPSPAPGLHMRPRHTRSSTTATSGRWTT